MHIESPTHLSALTQDAPIKAQSQETQKKFIETLTSGNASEMATCIQDGADVNQPIKMDHAQIYKTGLKLFNQFEDSLVQVYEENLDLYQFGIHPYFAAQPNQNPQAKVLAEMLYGQEQFEEIGYTGQDKLPKAFSELLDKLQETTNKAEFAKELFKADLDLLDGKFLIAPHLMLGMEWSPLALVVEMDDVEGVRLLLENGADPFFQYSPIPSQPKQYLVELSGKTHGEEIEFAELFHQYGLTIEDLVSDHYENSPYKLLEAAKEEGNEALVQFLEKHGYHLEGTKLVEKIN